MSVDDVWDRAERRQEKHEADLHARIAELEAAERQADTIIANLRDMEIEATERAEQAETLAKQRLDVQHDINKQYLGEKIARQKAEADRDAATNAMDDLARKLTEVENILTPATSRRGRPNRTTTKSGASGVTSGPHAKGAMDNSDHTCR